MIDKVAKAAVAAALDRLADAAADELPEVTVERGGERLVLSGRRLAAQWAREAKLRWFGATRGRR